MAYSKINWTNGRSGGTPINAENLNKMDEEIFNLDIGKVKRTLSNNEVAYVNINNEDTSLEVESENSDNTIVSRDSNGLFKVSDPVAGEHASNKRYIENSFSDKLDSMTNQDTSIYTNNNGLDSLVKVDDQPSGDSVVKRSEDGSVNSQSPVNDIDGATKEYVEDFSRNVNAELSVIQKETEILMDILDGKTYYEQESVTPVFIDEIPQNTLDYAEIYAVGGGSVGNNDEIISGKCKKILSLDENDEVKYEYNIPAEIISLDGYGISTKDTYNYIDFVNKTFEKNCYNIDLGTLNWSYNSARNIFVARLNGIKMKTGGGTGGFCARYDVQIKRYNELEDETMNVGDGSYSSNPYVIIKDLKFLGDAQALKESLQGIMLNYCLANPVTTDISEYLTDDNFIEIKNCNKVKFLQENDTEVPLYNKITYLIKL